VKVTDNDEMARVEKALVNSASGRGGERNVAARHGLKSLDEGALISPSSQIYRFEVSDYVALKSPG
jgi:hypothetical protein